VSKGLKQLLSTGDTDTFQLVDDNTQVYYYVGRTGEMLLYESNKVKERYGLSPRQSLISKR